MSFSGLFFIFLFLPIVLAAYYLVPRKLKNSCLFLFSLVFYAWGEPRSVLLLLLTIVVDYLCGLLIHKWREHRKQAKLVMIADVLINLLLLGFFKYSGLLVSSFNSITHLGVAVPEVLLPLGISFYTFKSITYAVDLYRGDAPVMKNPINFGVYVAFFPHMTAGPIVRYQDMAGQLVQRKESLEKFTEGIRRFLVGLFKKVLLADQLLLLANQVQYLGNPSTLTAWMGVLAFTFQIYFDFAGYSDMAIGLAKMFGFDVPENFDFPYLSRSVSEFWRRWHMTLGTWFREYVYIPLGGNRKGTLCTVRNLAVVWLLTGIWHGANWNFAVWGIYYGILIICEKLFLKKWLDRIPAFFQWLYAFLAAVIGWVFFSYTDIGEAFRVLGAMFGFASAGADQMGIYALLTFGPLLLVAALCSSRLIVRLGDKLRRSGAAGKIVWCVGMALLLGVTLTFLVSNAYSPFLYAKF